ncbi:MAG: bifunctional aspartate kinase/homoserine dehydrogenase I [Bdellovibrio sp.]|nr:bifunctional aspartate kinase/homoserine dehydrogenase I [Bdellovibrio sp.]
MNAISVHKFGGSSLANSECFKRVFNIINKLPNRADSFFVLSAMSGVTDKLVGHLNCAKDKKAEYTNCLLQLRKLHEDTLHVLAPDYQNKFLDTLNEDCALIEATLKKVWDSGQYSEEQFEYVTGFGELWSTWMMYYFMSQQQVSCSRLDAREFLIVEHSATGPSLKIEISEKKLRDKIKGKPLGPCIVTGYVATSVTGVPTTLKRNGSDFSASLLGSLLNAESITIWSDVDGCLSADPKLVPKAHLLEEISYHEAMEMAYFGSKVLHPKTMQPAMEKSIPIFLKNTFFPDNKGTTISKACQGQHEDNPVKALACMKNVSVINVEGAFMIGVPGIATRLFGALYADHISVIMISQASSEYSISFVVKSEDGVKAKRCAVQAFEKEMELGHIPRITLEEGAGILALIGDKMNRVRGISGQFFKALARANVNIRMIAQGSSERNISVVVRDEDLQKGLRAAHASFHLSSLTLNMALIGPGLIGATFLQQIEEQRAELKRRFNVNLVLKAICNSKSMFLSESISHVDPLKILKSEGVPVDFDKMLTHLEHDGTPHKIILDCTASDQIPNYYQVWLSQGFHIITPNKKGLAGNLERIKKISQELDSGLKRSHKRSGRYLYYETTVGAGLPIISTLKDLIATGDKIIEIEGVLSGTLSFIFNQFKSGIKFSEILKKAKDLGYTEPDPRDDLSGMDVARKVIILAREMGLEFNVEDVKVESLVPVELRHCSVDEFMNRLEELDAPMEEKRIKFQKEKKLLRFTGRICNNGNGEKITVGLHSFLEDHAFCRLKGSENCIAYTTNRYKQYPLVVQGPGAGAQVTAAGVFADLIKLAENLRADT